MNDGVPCSGLEESGAPWKDGEHSGDPAGACYTGVYATDAFVGRAIQVIIRYLVVLCCAVFCCVVFLLMLCVFGE